MVGKSIRSLARSQLSTPNSELSTASFQHHRPRDPILHRLPVRIPQQFQKPDHPHRHTRDIAAVPDESVEKRDRQPVPSAELRQLMREQTLKL